MCAHVYDLDICGNTVKMWLIVSDWLAIPALNDFLLHNKMLYTCTTVKAYL